MSNRTLANKVIGLEYVQVPYSSGFSIPRGADLYLRPEYKIARSRDPRSWQIVVKQVN